MSVFINNEKSRQARVRIKVDQLLKQQESPTKAQLNQMNERIRELTVAQKDERRLLPNESERKSQQSILQIKKTYLKSNQIILKLKNTQQNTPTERIRQHSQSTIQVPKPLYRSHSKQYNNYSDKKATLHKHASANSVDFLVRTPKHTKFTPVFLTSSTTKNAYDDDLNH